MAVRFFSGHWKLALRSNKGNTLRFHNSVEYNKPINSVQIRTLLFCGWRVGLRPEKLGFIWHQPDQPIFCDLMKNYAEIKSNASAAKTIKLLMNSIAGKFGQKVEDRLEKVRRKYMLKPSARIDDQVSGKWKLPKNADGYHVFDRACDFGDDSAITHYSSGQTHYLASLIWSWSHFLFFTTCYKLNYKWINARISVYQRPPILLYCDTDSIFLNLENCGLFENKQQVGEFFKSGQEMGYWQDSLQNFDTRWSCKYFDRMIILGKKLYWIGHDNLLPTLKGITKESIQEYVDQDGYNKFKTLCENHIKNLQAVDGITDREESVVFKRNALVRRKIGEGKFDLWFNNACRHRMNRIIRRVEDEKRTVNFTRMYDKEHVVFYDTFIQIFSLSQLPEDYFEQPPDYHQRVIEDYYKPVQKRIDSDDETSVDDESVDIDLEKYDI